MPHPLVALVVRHVVNRWTVNRWTVNRWTVRRWADHLTPLVIALACVASTGASAAHAQSAGPLDAPAVTTAPRDRVGGSVVHRLPPVNTYSIWVGGSVGTYSANANENLHGSLRMIGLQWTHDLFVWNGARFSWVTEILPLMLARSEAPSNRVPLWLRDAQAADPVLYARYHEHDATGFGISPLSAQAELPMSARWSAVVQVTSGVAWFTNVVPYGRATQGNFTVSPGVSVQWDATSSSRLALGYTMHHLSNASLGTTNPGMNSHIFYTRLSSRRAR